MKRFTVFTLLYLATGICLTVIAFQQPDSTLFANAGLLTLKQTLLFNAGLLYLCAVLSTFRFWYQAAINSKIRLRDQATWRQKLYAITPWLIIATRLFLFIFTALSDHQTTDLIANAVTGLPLILLSIEMLFTRSQIQS